MRARLLRPEFWTDSVMADLDEGARLTYMGLWCLADDDGYLLWQPREIAAALYLFDPPKRREPKVAKHLAALVEAGRVLPLECGRHAVIPTVRRHRVAGGRHTSKVHDVHLRECPVRTGPYPSRSVSDSVSESNSVSDIEESNKAANAFRQAVPPPPGYEEGKH